MPDFKDTLNILKTSFEMKANLSTKEPLIQQKWIKDQVYNSLLARNKNHSQWTLHDGPPYANGDIHVGHALNKIIKDIIVRYHSMLGEYCEYIPGWDTHGMPIEHALLKLGINKDPDLSIAQKRDNCKKFAQYQIANQKKQFARLGLLTDFSKYYATYDPQFEYLQLQVFVRAIEQKLIYQDLKPVYWSWSSQTALADAEVEYQNVTAASIYVAFKIASSNNCVQTNDMILIWTTTPWTIPANLAIAVNPKLNYVVVEANHQRYVLAQARLNDIKTTLNWDSYKIIKTFDGKALENIKYTHPLTQKTHIVILANYVSDEDGTGLVHNAPGFGNDDYLACKAYGIEPFAPIDNYGKFTKDVDNVPIIGVFYEKANDIIIEQLKKLNALVHQSTINHPIAHDWRTKKPVIYRATLQWFIDIKNIQKNLFKVLDEVKFINKVHRDHIIEMIENRTEWCISRQRYWGVPIPIIYDAAKSPILDLDLIKNIIDIIHREGSNVWYEKPVEYFLIPKYKDDKKYFKETDTLDVWFDSGTSWQILKAHNLNYPANIYFEGNDQYRGWFNASLINAVIATKQAPFQLLLSHGFVLDEKGHKMSKSLGNVVDPMKVCAQFGADVLRCWVAGSDFQDDIAISEKILLQSAETYRRIRNSLFKYCLANIADFDYQTQQNNNYREIDRFILQQLCANVDKINSAYANYDFSTVIQTINNHVIELSSWYFDIIKDILYCDMPNDPVRRTIQTVLYQLLRTYLLLLTPIIPHTCEEAYNVLLPHNKSVMFEHWITKIDITFDPKLHDKFQYFLSLKAKVYSELEKLRFNKTISKNNQALVTIRCKNTHQFLAHDLAQYLNVAKVIIETTTSNVLEVVCTNANFVKCIRCWNYYEPENMHDEQICSRCHKVIISKIKSTSEKSL